ncbi:hypothetical protein BC941DRAFT_451393 [Chlamydoabsidia padenii]|nr:hypothetical protein BC941DRAFT_451393 [Chlamydoabsidia padenii]
MTHNPSFSLFDQQPRHSSFCQPHRLSIAERFMAQQQQEEETIKSIHHFDPPTAYSDPSPHPLSLEPALTTINDTIKPTSILPSSLKQQPDQIKNPKRLYHPRPKPDPPSKSCIVIYDDHNKQPPEKKIPSREDYCHQPGCLVLCLFCLLVFGGMFLFLIWPRVPLLRIEAASVISPVEIVQSQQGWMENVLFTTRWLVNVTVDNRQNYLPTRLNKVQVIVKDAVTNALVGKGINEDPVVLMDDISTVSLLITVNYQARDMSDPTLADLVRACHRPTLSSALPLHFWITLSMFGFDWLGFTPTVIATPASSSFSCPV